MTRLSHVVGEMGKTRAVALATAAAWNVVLVVGAFVVPLYSTDGSAGRGSATLVGENGAWVAGLVALPLVIVWFVAAVLWRRREAPSAGPTAWTTTGLLIAFNVLAMLSIGIFVLPITVCLIVACASTKVAPAVYPDALASSAPR